MKSVDYDFNGTLNEEGNLRTELLLSLDILIYGSSYYDMN